MQDDTDSRPLPSAQGMAFSGLAAAQGLGDQHEEELLKVPRWRFRRRTELRRSVAKRRRYEDGLSEALGSGFRVAGD